VPSSPEISIDPSSSTAGRGRNAKRSVSEPKKTKKKVEMAKDRAQKNEKERAAKEKMEKEAAKEKGKAAQAKEKEKAAQANEKEKAREKVQAKPTEKRKEAEPEQDVPASRKRGPKYQMKSVYSSAEPTAAATDDTEGKYFGFASK
jgi:hypothetical protein